MTEAFAQLGLGMKGSGRTIGRGSGLGGLVFKRHASHAQQATVSKGKDGPGKRLGAKRSGGMYISIILSATRCRYISIAQRQ